MIRQSPDTKTSLRMKRKRAGWEADYLEEILTGVAREEAAGNRTEPA